MQVQLGDWTVVVGGYYTSGGATSSVVKLEGGEWSALPGLQQARYGHACAVRPGEILAFGG